MDSPFLNIIADELVQRNHKVVRFEFPYMAERRVTTKKRPPNRMPVLEETWQNVIKTLKSTRLFIGGKSMGGRVASMVADNASVRGVICLGYPFHPPGQPNKLRVEHLQSMKTATLILQGVRDTFGNEGEVGSYKLSKNVQISWIPDGDHSFKPRVKSGHTEHDNLILAVDKIDQFIGQLK